MTYENALYTATITPREHGDGSPYSLVEVWRKGRPNPACHAFETEKAADKWLRANGLRREDDVA